MHLKKHAVIVVIVVAAALFLSGPGTGDNSMQLSKDDNGREISVARGVSIRLCLESQGATGYLWIFEGRDPEYLEIVSEETLNRAGPGSTGGSVMHIWTLLPKKEGATQIRMNYYRPWEGKDKSADTFAVRLKILP